MKRKTGQLDRILEMIARNRLDEAEKQLDGLKPSGGYEAGYVKGIIGIIQTLRRPVRGSIIEKAGSDLENHLKSISETIRVHYLSQEDEGYFAAWVDFMRTLLVKGKKGIIKEKPREEPS